MNVSCTLHKSSFLLWLTQRISRVLQSWSHAHRTMGGTQKRLEENQTFEAFVSVAENDAGQEILPVCCSCKRIRLRDGTWLDIETYIEARTGVVVSHGLCPDCAHKLYGEEKTASSL